MLNISHQHHPARHGKSLASVHIIKFCIATGKSVVIGTSDVDACYDKIKADHPEAKLSKHSGYVLVEKA